MRVVTYYRELDICGSNFSSVFVDVLDPVFMVVQAVGRDADELDVPFGKLRRTTSDFAKLGGADRSKVSRVREEDGLKKVR
jgi:hypothetical protein